MTIKKSIFAMVALQACLFFATLSQAGTPAPQADQATTPSAAPSGDSAATATPAPVATSNDTNNYRGDHLEWSTAIAASAVPGGPPVYCLPPQTYVVGTKSTLDAATTPTTTQSQPDAGAGGKAASSAAPISVQTQWQKVRLADDRVPFFNNSNAKLTGTGAEKYIQAPAANSLELAALCPGMTKAQDIYEGASFYISDGDVTNADQRVGWEYGALIVPFKLQLSKGKALSGSASLGPYLGFRIPVGNDLVFSPVAFAGGSTIATSTTSSTGQTNSQNLFGLSYGAGLVFSVKDSFHVGLILGADHVNSTAGYQYNNKPWLSFEIGYSFAN